MSVIDDYLKDVPAPQKAELERVRNIIQSVVPSATEAISYGMPGFKYRGKYLVTFGAFKDHMSLFPGAIASDYLKHKLASYITSKGTIQFTIEHPLSPELIQEIIRIRVDEINASK